MNRKQKHELAQALVEAAGGIIENWRSTTQVHEELKGVEDLNEVRETLSKWLQYLPGEAFDIRLQLVEGGDPTMAGEQLIEEANPELPFDRSYEEEDDPEDEPSVLEPTTQAAVDEAIQVLEEDPTGRANIETQDETHWGVNVSEKGDLDHSSTSHEPPLHTEVKADGSGIQVRSVTSPVIEADGALYRHLRSITEGE